MVFAGVSNTPDSYQSHRRCHLPLSLLKLMADGCIYYKLETTKTTRQDGTNMNTDVHQKCRGQRATASWFWFVFQWFLWWPKQAIFHGKATLSSPYHLQPSLWPNSRGFFQPLWLWQTAQRGNRKWDERWVGRHPAKGQRSDWNPGPLQWGLCTQDTCSINWTSWCPNHDLKGYLVVFPAILVSTKQVFLSQITTFSQHWPSGSGA